MWPLIFHLVSTRWDSRVHVWIQFPAFSSHRARENSSRQMSRGSGSERCDLWFSILYMPRSPNQAEKVIPQFHQQQVHHFLLTRLHASRCAHSPSYFFLSRRWPDFRAPGLNKALRARLPNIIYLVSCCCSLSRPPSTFIPAPLMSYSGARIKKNSAAGPPPKSKHQWSDSKEGISIGVSLSRASFIYSLLCSGVCNRC